MAISDLSNINFQKMIKEIFDEDPYIRWHDDLPETNDGHDDYIIDHASVSLKYIQFEPEFEMSRRLVLMVKEHIEQEKLKHNGFRDFCYFQFVSFTKLAGNLHSRELDNIFCYFYQFRKIN